LNVPVFIQKLFGSVTWRMPGTDPFLFFTFDDGPTPEVTLQVLDILKRFDAKATFFCVGQNIKKHPDVFHKILEDGHAVGNHTFHHLDGWKTKRDVYLKDVLKCENSLQLKNQKSEIRNQKPLFRPPYGRITPSQVSILNSQFSIIMWDVLSRDYDQNVSEEQCLLNVTRHARKGSIVVFHDSMKAKDRVLYALPKVLEHFSKQHFSFKALSPDLH
jgi:peptidoglycan/xylan/chitin deacetylase (PgdA/CDA1 family)